MKPFICWYHCGKQVPKPRLFFWHVTRQGLDSWCVSKTVHQSRGLTPLGSSSFFDSKNHNTSPCPAFNSWSIFKRFSSKCRFFQHETLYIHWACHRSRQFDQNVQTSFDKWRATVNITPPRGSATKRTMTVPPWFCNIFWGYMQKLCFCCEWNRLFVDTTAESRCLNHASFFDMWHMRGLDSWCVLGEK